MCNKNIHTNNFCMVGFSKTENLKRYENYASLNPQMDTEEVVWRVNNHLDKEKYEYDVLISDCHNPLIIVNKYFKLPSDFVPKDIVFADECPMCKSTADAYISMRDAAKAEGFSIKVTSAYRSIAEQKALYEKFLLTDPVHIVDQTCARPGYSEHHTGLAVDIEGSIKGGRNIAKTPECAWLKENCHKYGFILRYLPETVEITGYASEPWHFRFVGTKTSYDMKEKNILSFEEYKERYL